MSGIITCNLFKIDGRGGSRAAATFKMMRFVIIVNGFQLLTIFKKPSILDVAAAQDPPLVDKYNKPNKNVIAGNKCVMFWYGWL